MYSLHAFTLNAKVSMDARAQAMNIIKATPLDLLIMYPRLYALHTYIHWWGWHGNRINTLYLLVLLQNLEETADGHDVVTSVIMQLSAEKLTNYMGSSSSTMGW